MESKRVVRVLRKVMFVIVGLVVIYSAAMITCYRRITRNLVDYHREMEGRNSGFEYFFIDKMSPFRYGYLDFTGFMPDFTVKDCDIQLIRSHLDLYFGERVEFCALDKEQRCIVLIVYGEERLERVLEAASDYMVEGFFDDIVLLSQPKTAR